jgi:hypothetical protein
MAVSLTVVDESFIVTIVPDMIDTPTDTDVKVMDPTVMSPVLLQLEVFERPQDPIMSTWFTGSFVVQEKKLIQPLP